MSTPQKILLATFLGLLACLLFGSVALNDWYAADAPTALEQRATAYRARALEAGADLYARHCAACHGARGEGIAQRAPALNRKDLFDGRRAQEARWTDDVESFLKNVMAAGRPIPTRPDVYSARMPPFRQEFGGALSASQVDVLSAFILNWQSAAPEVNAWNIVPLPARTPGASAQPTPQVGLARLCQNLSAPYAGKKSPYTFDDKTILAQGKQIYDDKCAACHGTTGKGDGPAAAALNPKPANLTDANLMRTLPVDCHLFVLAEGVRGTAMPPWKALGEDALWKVLLYTRAWSGVP